jgi:hypothetical protein
MTPEDIIAKELRGEIDARVRIWKDERRQLEKAVARIAELDALLAVADVDSERQVRVAAREIEESEPVRRER